MRIKLMMLAAAVLLIAGVSSMSIAEEDLFDTKDAAIHLDKGVSFLKAKKYNDAIAELEQSVSIAPEAEAYYYLGYAYYYKGKAGDAESRKKSIESFDKAYELDPSYTPKKLPPLPTAKTVEVSGKKVEAQDQPATGPTDTASQTPEAQPEAKQAPAVEPQAAQPPAAH